MFSSYRFDHPDNGQEITLAGGSYVWASLFGPFYVLAKGFVLLAVAMLLLSCGIGLAALVGSTLFVSFFQSSDLGILAIVFAPLLALVAQGIAAVELVRLGYLRRGWREGY